MTRTQHFSALFKLAAPLSGGNLAYVAMGMTDTIMMGWYSIEDLAALVLATTLFFLVLTGAGFGHAVMPMVATAVAKDDAVTIRRVTRMGIWLCLVYSAVFMPVLWFSEAVLLALRQEEVLSASAQIYLRIAGFGLFFSLVTICLKSYLSAQELTRVVFIATLIMVGLNAVFNWIFIFGAFGIPEMGIRGAAFATLLSNGLLCAATLIYALRKLPEHALMHRFWRPDWDILRQVAVVGFPIGLTALAEAGMFSASSIMMGWLGTIPLAAHGIALQVATITFMLHMGLSQAATVRAGNAIGRNDKAHLIDGAKVALVLSFVLSVFTMILFVSAPDALISFFIKSDDPARAQILEVGRGLIYMAALFQLVDGGQVLALGLLRGIQDTKVPMIFASVSYWIVGLPAGYILGFVFGFGGLGVWGGLVIGLGCAAALMTWRFIRKLEDY